VQVLGLIVAIIQAIPTVERWFNSLIATYISMQKEETKRQLVDAASLTARASTEEERFNACAAWVNALSRSRIE